MYKFKTERSFLKSIIYLQLNSKTASSGPPIGPILGQCGIPAAPFCKEFNERTSLLKDNIIVQVELFIFLNGEYNFDILFPSNSYFLKKIFNISKGFSKPGYIYSDAQEIRNDNVSLKYKYATQYIIYELILYKSKHNILRDTQFKATYKKLIGTLQSIGVFYN
jgi:large subunit ribosomal protein L11